MHCMFIHLMLDGPGVKFMKDLRLMVKGLIAGWGTTRVREAESAGFLMTQVVCGCQCGQRALRQSITSALCCFGLETMNLEVDSEWAPASSIEFPNDSPVEESAMG